MYDYFNYAKCKSICLPEKLCDDNISKQQKIHFDPLN